MGNKHVCVLGAGNMGSALVRALMRHGHVVTTWNRTLEKCQPLADEGAIIAKSISEAVRLNEIVIVCLTDHEAVISSIQSPEVANELNNKTVVQLSTVASAESVELSDWVTSKGAGYLDGGIMGYPRELDSDDCTILYSGPREVYENLEAALSSMGGRPRHLGNKPGLAAQFDKAVYACFFAHTLGLFQGAAICEAIGVPLGFYFDECIKFWDWSIQDSQFAKSIQTQEFSDKGGSVKIFESGNREIGPLCEQLGIDSGLSDAISSIIQRGIKQGLGELDASALVQAFREIQSRSSPVDD